MRSSEKKRQCFVLCGSGNTGTAFPQNIEKNSFLLRVKEHQMLFPRSSKRQLSSGGVEAGGREGGEEKEGSAGLTMFPACENSVFCVPTRPAARSIVWKPVL